MIPSPPILERYAAQQPWTPPPSLLFEVFLVGESCPFTLTPTRSEPPSPFFFFFSRSSKTDNGGDSLAPTQNTCLKQLTCPPPFFFFSPPPPSLSKHTEILHRAIHSTPRIFHFSLTYQDPHLMGCSPKAHSFSASSPFFFPLLFPHVTNRDGKGMPPLSPLSLIHS